MGPTLLAALLSLAPGEAPGEAPGVELEWEAPLGCPPRLVVQQWLDELVTPEARGWAQAWVQPDPVGLRLVLTVRTEGGGLRRTLEATTCASLARAAAVMIAVAVEPLHVADRSPIPPPPAISAWSDIDERAVDIERSEPDPEPQPTRRPVRPAPGRAAAVRRPVAWTLTAAGGAGAGPLPAPFALVRGSIGLQWARARLRLGATHRFARPTGSGDGVAVISLTSGDAWAGPEIGRGRAAVYVTGGLELGAMMATGRGFDRNRSQTSPWLGLGLRTGASWAMTRWMRAEAAITYVGAITRPSFATDDGTLVHETASLGVSATLGVEFRIPLDPSGRSRRPRG